MKCGSHFTLKQQLARHARLGCQGPQPTASSAADSSEAVLRCPSCSFTSGSEAELLLHVALHSDPLETPGQPPRYRCPQCPRVFLKSSLRKHLHSHTGERPYSCSVCNAGTVEFLLCFSLIFREVFKLITQPCLLVGLITNGCKVTRRTRTNKKQLV